MTSRLTRGTPLRCALRAEETDDVEKKGGAFRLAVSHVTSYRPWRGAVTSASPRPAQSGNSRFCSFHRRKKNLGVGADARKAQKKTKKKKTTPVQHKNTSQKHTHKKMMMVVMMN